MAYFYVKNGGTATGNGGRYASQKTGTWATAFSATSEYYNSVADAFGATTAPADGDFILSSHLHNLQLTAATAYGVATTGDVVIIVSVDDLDITTYKKGSKEFTNGFFLNLTISEGVVIYGFTLHVLGSFSALNITRGALLFDCTYRCNVTSGISVSDLSTLISNTTDQATASITPIAVANLSHIYDLKIDGATIQSDFLIASSNRNKDVIMVGLDASNQSTLVDVYASNGASTSTKIVSGLHLPSSWAGDIVAAGAFAYRGARAILTNYGSGADDWSYYVHSHGFTVEAVNSVYYDDSPTAPDGTTKISYKVDTDSLVTIAAPIFFDLPVRPINFNSASENTITLKVAYTGTGLTDRDIALIVTYADVTNPNLLKFAASWPTANGFQMVMDPLIAATNLTDTGVELTEWTGLTAGDDTYDLSVTITSANAHANQIVVANISLFITKDFGAESLYVSNHMVLS